MQPTPQTPHRANTLYPLILLGFFTISGILVLTLGGNIYSSVVRQGSYNAQLRTTLLYTSEKLRQNDKPGSIEITSVEGIPALKLNNTYNTEEYSTYLYCWDEKLRELTVRASESPKKEQGQGISPAAAFQISQINERLYHILLTSTNGKEMSLYVNIRSR